MKKRRGSITAYLSLILLVMLSLFLQCLYSVRIQHARELTACAAQQGLYSLFSLYDRTLLKEYELLFLDSGFGTTDYRTDLMGQTVKTYADEMLQPLHSQILSVSALSEGSASEVSFTSISIATDHNGTPFRRQVLEAMKANLGSAGVQLLLQKLSGNTSGSDSVNQNSDRQDAITDYETAKGAASEELQQEEPEEESEGTAEVPENFKNPIEVIAELMTKGILALILPEDAKVPTGSAELETFVSHRTLQTGFGTIIEDNASDAGDKMLLCAYGLWKFPSYAKQGDGNGLRLQQEYLLEGKKSDAENLSAVLTKLLIIREAVNLAYLWSDPTKVSEMTAMSEIIVASLALPVALPIVMHALAVCWAFAESVAELRALMDEGKVPLLPNSASWRVSLEKLADFTGQGETLTQISGLTYQEYLAALMMGTDADEMVLRMMDMVEMNMRTCCGKPDFRLDHCVDQVEMNMQVQFRHAGTYQINRNYGYEEQM